MAYHVVIRLVIQEKYFAMIKNLHINTLLVMKHSTDAHCWCMYGTVTSNCNSTCTSYSHNFHLYIKHGKVKIYKIFFIINVLYPGLWGWRVTCSSTWRIVCTRSGLWSCRHFYACLTIKFAQGHASVHQGECFPHAQAFKAIMITHAPVHTTKCRAQCSGCSAQRTCVGKVLYGPIQSCSCIKF
jgi:hypothetical protein